MVIANPIYDTVFKKLMENERVAKFFVGTLMDEIIEDIKVMPQEFTYRNSLDIMTIFRLDFIATIKTKEGNFKKILIEIQKGRNVRDLMRFRNYLAEQYKKEDLIDSDGLGIEEEMTLPITSIYILGFNLEGIDSACLKVERNYVDLIDKKIVTQKSYFIENLTHDSYIVQVKRITDRYQTSLDKLLSVFEQRNFLNDDKIIKEYSHIPDVEEVQLITDILHYSGTSPEERRRIEIEIEAWRTFNASQSDATKKAIRDLEKTRKELEEEKKEKENLKLEKDKIIEKEKTEKEEIKKELENQKIKAEQQEKELQKQKLESENSKQQLQEMQKMMEELKRRLDNSDN
jgi:hypothetical protein